MTPVQSCIGYGEVMMTEIRLLPKPPRDRDRFLVPVPLYGDNAQLLLPVDMTEAEARKIANVVLAFGKITPHNARALSE